MYVKKDHWKRFFLESMNARWSRAESTSASIANLFLGNEIESGRILDLCCGNGRLTIWLARQGYEVVGIDISASFLDDARRKSEEHNVSSMVTFQLGDMRDIDDVTGTERLFDGVINFSTSIGYWDDKTDEMIFRKVRRITRRGGLLIIGELDHTGHLIHNFRSNLYFENESAVILTEATFDEPKFKSAMRYYSKEADHLKFVDSLIYQVHVYGVEELSSLLNRSGWKVIGVYGNLETREPVTEDTLLNVVAKAI
jgi:SAM-dependent methyltransferase